VAEHEPEWIERHGLTPGALYHTNDSDLILEFVGVAQVHEDYGMRLVMVFRDAERQGPLLTMGQADSESCGGYTPLGEHLAWRMRRPHD
jgi:hypothetical protein